MASKRIRQPVNKMETIDKIGTDPQDQVACKQTSISSDDFGAPPKTSERRDDKKKTLQEQSRDPQGIKWVKTHWHSGCPYQTWMRSQWARISKVTYYSPCKNKNTREEASCARGRVKFMGGGAAFRTNPDKVRAGKSKTKIQTVRDMRRPGRTIEIHSWTWMDLRIGL